MTPDEMLAKARRALVHFNHHDIVGSLADLHDALHGDEADDDPR